MFTRWDFVLDAAVKQCIASAGEEGGVVFFFRAHNGVELVFRRQERMKSRSVVEEEEGNKRGWIGNIF